MSACKTREKWEDNITIDVVVVVHVDGLNYVSELLPPKGLFLIPPHDI
jgi:hypothetical protein